MALSNIKNLIECPNCLKKFEFGSSYLNLLENGLDSLKEIQRNHEKLRKAISEYKQSNNDQSDNHLALNTQSSNFNNALVIFESKFDEFSNSNKTHLNKIVDELAQLKKCLESGCCQVLNAGSVTEFSYDEEQRLRIGQPLMGYPRCRLGVVEKLDANGECQFVLSEKYPDVWCNIVENNVGEISSRPILLPTELSGLAVRVVLLGLDDRKADKIKVSLYAQCNEENKVVQLPTKIGLQMKMELIENRLFESEIHKFAVEKLHNYAKPDTFNVTLVRDIKSSHIITNRLPNIWFKFSKW